MSTRFEVSFEERFLNIITMSPLLPLLNLYTINPRQFWWLHPREVRRKKYQRQSDPENSGEKQASKVSRYAT